MTLRCFLFCTDEGTSDIIRQVLTALGVEAEVCATPSAAVQAVSSEPFQLVIIDWDQQPEAGMVLHAAQERKVSERPLTLAIVSDDGSAPKALQAGANSTLRRPLAVNQITDTLTTARDLLRSRFAPAKSLAVASATNAPATLPGSLQASHEKTLRSGEFLQPSPLKPSGQFVTESETPVAADQSDAEPVDALKDLEPVAAAAPPSPPPVGDEPKGLEWYLKRKGLQSVYTGAAAAAAPAPAPAPDNKPELLGYNVSSSSSPSQREEQVSNLPPEPRASSRDTRKEEAALFSYIAGESGTEEEPSPSRFRIGKGALIAASVLAAAAIAAAPQAPWHSRLKIVLGKAQHSLHTWLHPQPVTAVSQAPISHEDFGRPGDEYKLPVAETIPDATTDPSQIEVLPAVDPNAKKPAPDGSTPDQLQAPVDQTNAPTPDASQTPAVQVQENPQPSQPVPAGTSPAALPVTNAPATAVPNPPAPTAAIRTEVPPSLRVPLPASTAPAVAPAPRQQPSQYVPPGSKVPTSLQSQMTVMVPDSSGNKPIDSAMPAIEPVTVPEAAERPLLIDQPAIGYPASARGQQGTVILQVLVGRDGTVQDAKFVQGSLAFARNAIEGVRRWKFKPYAMNGRPVSVQTTLTIKLKPGQ